MAQLCEAGRSHQVPPVMAAASDGGSQHLLLLGDGDFSLACARATAKESLFVTTTSYDTLEEAKAKYADSLPGNFAKLLACGSRVRVVCGVDATNIATTLPPPKGGEAPPLFTRIEFRCPHTGTKNVEANRQLLRGFLASGAAFMAQTMKPVPRCAPNCDLVVTLKTTGKYNAWAGDLRVHAAEVAPTLRLRRARRPPPDAGYVHRTTSGQDRGVQNDFQCEWTFKIGGGGEGAPLPAWLQAELEDQCPRCRMCNFTCTSEEDLLKHLNGKAHARRAQVSKRKRKFELRAKAREEKKMIAQGVEDTPGERRCRPCGVTTNSAAAWEMHIAGKRHRALCGCGPEITERQEPAGKRRKAKAPNVEALQRREPAGKGRKAKASNGEALQRQEPAGKRRKAKAPHGEALQRQKPAGKRRKAQAPTGGAAQ